jgi:hypothetical protein
MMEPVFTLTPTPSNQTESHPPRHGPPYGFYIGLAVLTVIVTIGLIYCWRINHNQRGRNGPCNQLGPDHGRPLHPTEDISQPAQAYVLPSTETLPLYRPEHAFTKQLLQAWTNLGSPAGTRPPSYRSRLTLDLEVAVKNIDADDR